MTRKKTGQGILEGYNQVEELTHRLDVESVFASETLTRISMFVRLADPGTSLFPARAQEGDLCTPALTFLHSLNSF